MDGHHEWITHVAVKVGVDTDALVIPEKFRPVTRPLHITLHNKFALQQFQVQSFISRVKAIATSYTRRIITFTGSRMLPNTNGSGTFYALTTDNDPFLAKLASAVKDAVDEFRPRMLEHFDEPLLHMSFAVADGVVTEAVPHPRVVGITKSIECVIGGKEYTFKMKARE